MAVMEDIDTPMNSTEDILDFIAYAADHGTNKLMIKKEHLHADFFRLNTRLADDIIRKFIDHYMKVAIVGDLSETKCAGLNAHIRRDRRSAYVFFTDSVDAAVKYLTA
ncbi:MAG: DUF4180 domain-containing protein [Candidatus Marinimicrobia bacterium]|nr:DUF4180 domain-containing protein [Candidatus Neomarinimicrobiota bacterium]